MLVVDDDAMLRLHAVDLVQAAGFAALEASSAAEAIEILHARQDIRIVFADVQMPGTMNGLALAKAVRERWPPVEIILTSGRIRPSADQMPERGVFLAKPYAPRELERALRSFGQ